MDHTVKSTIVSVLLLGMLNALGILSALAALGPDKKLQIRTEADLARALATDGWASGGAADRQRAAAIDWIREHPESVGWLLRWTEVPPPGINRLDLDRGLIEAFGALRVEKGIPFLIRSISFGPPTPVWGHTAGAIIAESPAIGALLRIGRPASAALMKAYSQPLTPEDRLAIVFALAQLQDPSAKEFLVQARGQACEEVYRAAQGLKLLGMAPSGSCDGADASKQPPR